MNIEQTYIDNITAIVNTGAVKSEDIYMFSKDELKILFDEYFTFCYDQLKNHSNHHNILPARFYFRKDLSVNASATKTKSIGLIGYNVGNIIFLNQLSQTIDFIILNNYKWRNDYAILIKEQAPIGRIATNFISTITYYHEVAHLIQHSDALEIGLQEIYILKCNNPLYHHTLEWDADINGADATVLHLLDNWLRNSKTKKSLNNLSTLENLLQVCLLCLIIYHMTQYNANNLIEMYYLKYDHPHPLMRYDYITSYCLQKIKNNKFGKFNINQDRVIMNVLMLLNEYYKYKNESNKGILLRDLYLKTYNERVQYLSEIRKYSRSLKFLAIHGN